MTADEKMTLKTGAYGAVFLVSNAVPGFLDLIKESFAASGVLADTTGLVKDALNAGGLPQFPRDSPDEVEAIVLPALRRSVEILQARAPQEVDNYRTTVIAAAEQVAKASNGVADDEAAIMVKVRYALDPAVDAG